MCLISSTSTLVAVRCSNWGLGVTPPSCMSLVSCQHPPNASRLQETLHRHLTLVPRWTFLTIERTNQRPVCNTIALQLTCGMRWPTKSSTPCLRPHLSETHPSRDLMRI